MVANTDHAQLPLPPPLIFLGYLVSAVVLEWWIAPFPWHTPPALRLFGGFLVIAGFLLAASAIREMRRMHTTPDERQATTVLVTTGPYRFTRNPIYLGFFLVYLGFTLLAGTLWGVLFSPFLIATITRQIIHAEEVYLREKFGDQYNVYTSLVRRWL
jgi:protein-S-isoprenylcysteine O-methyltransferase Ste14